MQINQNDINGCCPTRSWILHSHESYSNENRGVKKLKTSFLTPQKAPARRFCTAVPVCYVRYELRAVRFYCGKPGLRGSSPRAYKSANAFAQCVGETVDVVSGILRAEAYTERAVGIGRRQSKGKQCAARSVCVR